MTGQLPMYVCNVYYEAEKKLFKIIQDFLNVYFDDLRTL